MSYNLPNPSLVGILLVVSTHNGPQIAFSYPEDISTRSLRGLDAPSDGEDIDDEDYEIDLDAFKDSDGEFPEGDADGGASAASIQDQAPDSSYTGAESARRQHKGHEIHHDMHHEYTQMQVQSSRRDKQWDASDPGYYLGTKSDIMSFLDAREAHRLATARDGSSGTSSGDSSGKASKIDGHNATNSPASADMAPLPGLAKASPAGSSPNSASAEAQKPEKIFGFEPEQLGEMLCPPRAMCNRRFDVMLEKTVFLGLPVHVGADGSWRTSKKRRNNQTATATATATTTKGRNSTRERANSTKKPAGAEEVESAENEGGENAESNAVDESNNGDGKDPTAMSMFHLVFVLSPPDIERNYRVDEMFYNVTSKLSLILRYEQQKHDYVWAQVREILRVKEQFRSAEGPFSSGPNSGNSGPNSGPNSGSGDGLEAPENSGKGPHPVPAPPQPRQSLSSVLISQSPLCRMVADCFAALSASQIANLNINSKLRSFQIPRRIEFHSLPEPTVPYVPGSCLSSTINCLGGAGLANVGETSRYSDSNFLERLLGSAGSSGSRGSDGSDDGAPDDDDDGSNANPDNIVHLALLLCDEPEAVVRDVQAAEDSPVAQFVRMLTPTESLLAISTRLREQSGGAQHLSMAEIKSLALHLVYWRRARVIPPLNTRAIYVVSPMAPLATNFHDDIVRFSQQFPTVPSLPSFLKLLSTRTRKPRQFASIVPSKDHREMYLMALAWLVRFGYVTQLHTYIWLKVSKKVKMKVEEELEEELARTKPGDARQKAAGRDKPQAAVDNSSKQVQAPETVPPAPEAAAREIDRLQKRFEASSRIPDIILEDDGDTILVDPGRASSLERRWITKIIHDECHLSPESTAVFYTILKYMNGKNSLELLLLRENVSRSELRRLLSEIDDYIISVRHW